MNKNKFSSLFLTATIFATIIAGAIYLNNFYLTKAVAQETKNKVEVQGFAWSDNIGWIKFNPRYGGVYYDKTDGNLSGWAWSDNIGWIKFDGLSAENGSGVGGNGSVVNTNDGSVSGWARAYRAIETEGQTLGGWDGWIKFDHGQSNPVTVGPAGETKPNVRDFHGYAWGSDVVGWISFNCKEGGVPTPPPTPGTTSICGTSDYKVWVEGNGDSCPSSDCNIEPSKLGVSCSISPTKPEINKEITFTATATHGVPNYTYNWTIDKKITKTTTGEKTNSIKKTYSKVGNNKKVYISVVDQSKPKQNADSECIFDVADNSSQSSSKPNIKIIEI